MDLAYVTCESRFALSRSGNAVSSGVYLYKLEAGSFTQVKKMCLVRQKKEENKMNSTLRCLGVLSLFLIGLAGVMTSKLWAQEGSNNFRLAFTDSPDDCANSNTRDIIAGSDLDRDGKYEIIITDYSLGGQVHVYEVVGDNSVEWVWSSPGTTSTFWAPTRAVQVADLDADGREEILLSIVQNGAPPGVAGIHVFEWDGVSDNGYGTMPAAVIPIDPTISGGLTEDFVVDDIDGDNRQEILYVNRGVPHVNRCYVVSISGTFENSWTVVTEALFTQEAGDFNGLPWDVVVSNLDGDGFKEAVFSIQDGAGGLFIVETTGINSYTHSTTVQIDPTGNGFSLEGMAAADFNGDGKDELYVALTQTGDIDPGGPLIVVTGGTDVSAITIADNVRYLRQDGVGCYGMAVGDQDHGVAKDGPDIYTTSFGNENVGGFIQDFEFIGTDVFDPASYVEHVIFQDVIPSWPGGLFQIDIPRVDMDGDGRRELVVSYTGETATGVYFRMFEYEPTIDIKPGSYPNSVNPKSKGVIPVAILTTAAFNATTVDPLSVRFGPNNALESHGRGHVEDADGDGDLDMVLHFKTQETGIQCGATEASLTGQTTGGQAIIGSDAIVTVGCGPGKNAAEDNAPVTFALEQNYPNPFNPSTTINYQLPTNSYVTLKVLDLLGREITTLVDAPKEAGTHTVEWNAAGAASGVYVYRLCAGDYVATKKLVLLR